MNWIVTPLEDSAFKLAHEIGITQFTAQILINRGVSTPLRASAYLNPSLGSLPDPFLIPDMKKAAQRICAAIVNKEKIAIFGDYDVDGVTGTALLSIFLKHAGADHLCELPDRLSEGYGITAKAIERLHAQGVRLIITVDNGTRSIDELALAKKLNMDVIVTDHHDLGNETLQTVAFVNPKRMDRESPFYFLSGCGVAFMLVRALNKEISGLSVTKKPTPNWWELLDLVALGTIADIVPLTHANRVLVKHGLLEIANSKRIGIRALLNVCGTKINSLSPDAIAFQLAPRINAAGRIGDAKLALKLLLTENASEADELATTLDRANRERQKIEDELVTEALAMIDGKKEKAAYVLHSKNWHPGVLGIAASKIARQTLRPTIIISKDTEPARGSARGVSGINLMDALSFCEDTLVRFGGHAMAAGVSVESSKISEFVSRFTNVCMRLLPNGAEKSLLIDAEIGPKDITERLIKELSLCEPFGIDNRGPLLVLNDTTVVSQRTVGTNHLKLRLKKDNINFNAIAFGMAEDFAPETKKISIVFTPELNTWNDQTSVQLKVKDLKAPS